ncbi:hypothetical protein HDU89_002530 [Geranomyces variabilis]|nr:hypothetical protein HDU89_002530 [Geranomyces variabilis]
MQATSDQTRILPNLAAHGPGSRHVRIQTPSDLQSLSLSHRKAQSQQYVRPGNSKLRKTASSTETGMPPSTTGLMTTRKPRTAGAIMPPKALPPVTGVAGWDVGTGAYTAQRGGSGSRKSSFGQGEKLRRLLDRNVAARDNISAAWRIDGALPEADSSVNALFDANDDSYTPANVMVVRGATERSKAPAIDHSAAPMSTSIQQGQLCGVRLDSPGLSSSSKGAALRSVGGTHVTLSHGSTPAALRNRRASYQLAYTGPVSQNAEPFQAHSYKMPDVPIQMNASPPQRQQHRKQHYQAVASEIVIPEGRARVRMRWKMAMKAVHNLLRATSVFRIAPAVAPAWQRGDPGSDSKRANSVLKPKVHFLLSKTRLGRTLADFAAVDPHLVKLSPFLESLTVGQRKQFYLGTLTYESHTAGSMLLRDGGTAESVYFLLSGSLEMYKEHRSIKIKQGVIGPGGVVGQISVEDVLKKTDVKRPANVVCLETCEMLRVDVDEYTRTVFGHDGGNTDTLVSLLNSHHYFQSTLETVLLKAAQSCALCTYAPGTEILSENDTADRLFFLCKGTASASRRVPFLHTYPPSLLTASAPVAKVLPYDDRYPPSPGEEVVIRNLPLGPVETGETFPALLLPDGMKVDPTKSKRAEFWPKDRQAPAESDSKVSDAGPAGTAASAPLCNVTVVATTEVQCAVFSVNDFLRLATNEMVEMVMACGDKYNAKMIELQESYLVDTDPTFRPSRPRS